MSWWLLLIPVIGRGPAAVLDRRWRSSCPESTSSTGTSATCSRHLMRFWFYLSPTLYGMDMVAQIADTHPTIGPLVSAWFKLNPMTYILTAYRDVIYYGTAPDWASLAGDRGRLDRDPRPLDPVLQAGRAQLREGPVSETRASTDGEWSAIEAREPGCPVQPPLHQEDHRARHLHEAAAPRPGRATRRSGRCATWASSFARGESLGVIGPNGAGKSTLLLVARGDHPAVGGIRNDINGHISGAAEPLGRL